MGCLAAGEQGDSATEAWGSWENWGLNGFVTIDDKGGVEEGKDGECGGGV